MIMARNQDKDNETFVDIVVNNFPDTPVFEVDNNLHEDEAFELQLPDGAFTGGFVVLPFPLEVLEFWRTILGFDIDDEVLVTLL